MASRLFLDANVLLEYFLKRKNQDEVRAMFLQIEGGIFKAFTSTSVMQIVGYILMKAYGKATTKKILLGLLDNVKIIDCKHDTVTLALNSSMPDIEDAMQYYTALEHNLDYYVTFDDDLIKQTTVQLPILAPKNILKQ